MATPVATGVTIDDLAVLPDDTVIRHLIDGDLYVVTPPTIRHQVVVAQVFSAMLDHRRRHGGVVLTAPAGVRFSDTDMPEPDLLYVAGHRTHLLGERYVEGPPDLVVEVSSPSTRRIDLVLKRRQYERFGVPEYWFVDLDADRVDAYRLEGDGYAPPVPHERGARVRARAVDGLVVEVDDILGV